MRKLITLGLIAAAAMPTVASAQSRAEVRHDRRELRQERQDLRDARRYGDRYDVQRERRDVRDARRELREDRRDLRRTRYVAPYSGWTYRTVTPGYRLQPGFYSNRYVVNPGQYRLAPVGRFQTWVRYGDDLLLVNTRTGRVLQVLRNRYW